MRKFEKLYEGTLSRLGQKLGKKADKAIARIPFTGAISKANKAVSKIENYFQNIQGDMKANMEALAKLKGKADNLANKLLDIFGEDPDKDELEMIRRLEDRSNAIKSIFGAMSKMGDVAGKVSTDTSYKQTAPEDEFRIAKPKKKVTLKRQNVAASYQYDNDEAINEAIDYIDVTCTEIEEIFETLN